MEGDVVRHSSGPSRKKGLHYGYVIVITGFLTQGLSIASQRNLSLSMIDVAQGLGVTLGEVGLISSAFGLTAVVAGLFWGWMADRIGPRLTMSTAGAITSVGLILFGLVGLNSLVLAVATYSIVGLGGAGIYMAVLPKLISAWFAPKKRGHALRIVVPGGGLVAMLLTMVLPVLIANAGLNYAFIILGCFGILISLVFFTVLRDDPYQKGLTPIGSPRYEEPTPAPKTKKGKNEFVEIFKLPITWHLGIMYIVFVAVTSANSTFYIASIRTAGYSGSEAGFGVTLASLVALVGMQIWAPLSDRLERKTVICMGVGGYAIVAFIYFLVLKGSPALWVCYVFICLMQGMLSVSIVFLAAIGDYFPAEYRGTGGGVISTMSMVGTYSGPALAGAFVGMNAGQVRYGLAFAAACALVAAIVVMTLPNLKKGRRAKGAE